MEKPYITAAFICEKVLQEKDGVLTAVRIIDKVFLKLPPEGLPGGAKPAIAVTGLLGLKSGPVVGEFDLKIGVTAPSGEKKQEVMLFRLQMLGGDQGQNIIMNVGLGIEQEGLYWFDVSLGDELLTRIPLLVVITNEPTEPEQG